MKLRMVDLVGMVRPSRQRRTRPPKKNANRRVCGRLETLEGRLMLTGPGELELPELSHFASSEALEEVLLTEGLERWQHLFGRAASLCQRPWWVSNVRDSSPGLFAGDADQDFDFDQLDLVRVQIAAKYLTGEPAAWGEGDWNCAPGGSQGNPPLGDGVFNQLDIISALSAGFYLVGWYGGPSGGGAPSHSATNTQVEGVDEGDRVETDGNYLYTISGQQVVIADSWPVDELRVVSRVNVPGQPFALYLREDRLTVLSEGVGEFDLSAPLVAHPFRRMADMPLQDSRTGINVTVLDVTDRHDPSVVQQTALHGSYVDSRAIGDSIYLVTADRFGLPAPEIQCLSPEQAGGVAVRCKYETQQQYLARVEDRVLELGLPHFSAFGPEGELTRQGLYGEYTTIYEPTAENQENLLSVIVFNTRSEVPGPASFINVPTSDADIMYASTDSLYLLDPDWGADEWARDGQATSIVRFDLDATHGQVTLGAVGSVPGRALNSFSVDEYDGQLRIATTTGSWRNAVSTVYVLEQVGDELQAVGQTTDMARGEEIFAVRFMDDRGYVVTFPPQSTALFRDPLFTIDLSDPYEPRVLGELEIPGFSNYLHPVQDGYLIGLGRNADERTGRRRELQVSLFDVSDPSQPALAERFDMDVPIWAETEAIGDHHALAYFPDQQILTIPVTAPSRRQSFDRDDDGIMDLETTRPTTDLWVLRIDPAAHEDNDAETKAIELLGKIEHDADIRRSVRIEELLYSLSDTSVHVHELVNPEVSLASLHTGQAHLGIPVYHAEREDPATTPPPSPKPGEPLVVAVRVGSTAWDPDFVNRLDPDLSGATPIESQQVVPHAGIDQIKVTFSEDVLVGRRDLTLRGAGPNTYTVRDFLYVPDAATAVWTFTEPMDADTISLTLAEVVDLQGKPLDATANGRTDGTFAYEFRVLAGDLNQDGIVEYDDVGLARSHERLDAAGYDLLADMDGNGATDEFDVAAVQQRWGQVLPGIVPRVLGDTNGDQRFDQLDIVHVLQGGKFLTKEPAHPSEGDWNADGVFDQLDLVVALQRGHYRDGPDPAVKALDDWFGTLR